MVHMAYPIVVFGPEDEDLYNDFFFSGFDESYEIQISHTADFELAQQPFQDQQSKQAQRTEDYYEIEFDHQADFGYVEQQQQPSQDQQSEQAQRPEDNCKTKVDHTADLEIVQQPFQAQDIENIEALLKSPKRSLRKTAAIKVQTRVKWSSNKEDWLLIDLWVNRCMKWTEIAKELNKEFHNCLEVRTGKACRERWRNHFNPELKSKRYIEGDWTQLEDDLIIMHACDKEHPPWSKIAKLLSGRTEHAVKNRYKQLDKKLKLTKSSESTGGISSGSTVASNHSSGREVAASECSTVASNDSSGKEVDASECSTVAYDSFLDKKRNYI
jgi:hypothetical protein